MRRGTTPRVTVTVPIDLTSMAVYLTFKQGSAEATLTNADFEAFGYADGKTTISASLTQEQTLGFKAGERVRVQIRAIDGGGRAVASDIASVKVTGLLRDGSIEYGG